MSKYIIEAKNISKHYPVRRGLLQKVIGWVRAIDDVSFNMEAGKTLSLVGESGAGKTTTARMLLMLEEVTTGNILFEGRDLKQLSKKQIKQEYRPRIQAVQQNPWSSMNPRMRIKDVIAEPLVVNNTKGLSRKDIKDKVLELLNQVGLRPDHAEHFPHEFSGGQRQRLAVARALALNPSIVVLDEPVSALDVSIRAQIMNLLKDLQDKYNLCYLMIAHNLATVRFMSHTVAIMYLGQIVEYGDAEEVFQHPLHPYTRALMSASQLRLPEDEDENAQQIVLGGEMPSPLNPPSGCRFHTRCTECRDTCSTMVPAMNSVGNHLVRCNHYAA